MEEWIVLRLSGLLQIMDACVLFESLQCVLWLCGWV